MADVNITTSSLANKAAHRSIVPVTADFVIQKNGANVEAINMETGAIDSTNADLSIVIEAILTSDKHIHIKSGAYNMDTQCDITSIDRFSITGDGSSTRITQTYVTVAAGSTWLDGFRITTCDDIVLRDFYINGNGAAGYSGGANTGNTDNTGNNIHFLSCNNVEISGVESTNSYFHGIFGTGICSGINVHDNHLHTNGFRAIHIHGSDVSAMEGNRCVNNLCHDDGFGATWWSLTDSTGIFMVLNNCRGHIVTGNVVYDEVGYGIQVGGIGGAEVITSEHSIIQGNYVSRCGNGMSIDAKLENCSVLGNVITDSTAAGLFVDDVDGITFIGNMVENSGTVGFSFLDSNNCSVVGGRVINSGSHAVVLVGSGAQQTGMVFTGIHVENTPDSGFQMQDCSDCIVSNNVLIECGTGTNDAIRMSTAGLNSVIKGNVIKMITGARKGIQVDVGSNGNLIEGNRIEGNAVDLQVQSDNNQIQNNYFSASYTIAGDGNQVQNNVGAILTLSGDNNLCSYNSVAATDTGVGNKDIIWV